MKPTSVNDAPHVAAAPSLLTEEEALEVKVREIPVPSQVQDSQEEISSPNITTIEELIALEHEQEYEIIIAALRTMLKADPTLLENTWVKSWMAKRWRNIFIREACHNKASVTYATASSALNYLGYKIDNRSPAQKVSECFLRMTGPGEWVYIDGTDDVKAMPEPMIPDNLTAGVMFAPGLVNGWLPVRAFHTGLPAIQKRLGVKVMRADAHPMRGCVTNVEDYMQALTGGRCRDADGNLLEGMDFPEKFICMGYSKGGPDLLTLFTEHPEMQSRCRAMYTWAGAVGGSYMANEAYENFKQFPNAVLNVHVEKLLCLLCPVIELRNGPLYRLPEVDVGDAILHLTTHYREAYIKKNLPVLEKMPFPVFHITGSTEEENLPYFQIAGYRTLARYDNNNDMQLTQDEATMKLPKSCHLAMVHANHWDMSYGNFPLLYTMGSMYLAHYFPRDAAMAAMVLLSAELGLMSD